MADFDNSFEDDIVENSDVVAKRAAGETVTSTADIITKPKQVKDTINNVKDNIENVKGIVNDIKDAKDAGKEASKATKDVAKATKDAANTTKEAAKAAKDAAKTAADTTKTAVEAAKTAADVATDAALGASTMGMGTVIKKGVQLGIKVKADEKRERVEKLSKISKMAKAQDADDVGQNIKEDAKAKAKKKRQEMISPMEQASKAIRDGKKKANRPLLLIAGVLIVLALLVMSAAAFLYTGNSISIASLNYSLGDKGNEGTYTLLGLAQFVGVNEDGNVVLKTGIEKDDKPLEILGKSMSYASKVVAYFWEKGTDHLVTLANNMMSGVKEKLNIKPSETDIMKDEIEFIAQKQDYSSMVNLYADYMDKYMEKAWNEKRQEVSSVSRKNGYNEDLTRAAFESCGNPFSNVDYCALLCAYSVKEYDVNSQSLYKFKSTMEDASKKMLTVTYTDAYQKHIIPLPIYEYEEVKQNVWPSVYAMYYGDNSPEVRWQLAYSLNKEAEEASDTSGDLEDDIAWHKKKVKEYTDLRDKCKKFYDFYKFFGSSEAIVWKANMDKMDTLINIYNLKLLGLYNKRDNADMEAFFLRARANNVLSGAEDAHIEDIKYYSQDSFEISYYKIKEDASAPDGKKVAYNIDKEEGQIAPSYEELWYLGMPGCYKYKGDILQKPEVEYIKYGQPTMHPFKSTDVFYLFDLEPDEKYPWSLGAGANEITNQQQYDIEYQELDALVDLKRHKSVNVGAGHSCSLTKEQIQHYLDLMPADTSLNRKQLCKTAMGLTGAVSYQMGGPHNAIGWDENWWQPTGDDKYPYTGPDCAGFVTWAYHTAFTDDPIWNSMHWTGDIIRCSDQIDHSSLKPGDLGLNNASQASGDGNHVGIFICYDEAGNEIWCHCGGKAHTVNTENRSFNVYFRPRSNSLEGSNYWSDEIILYGSAAASNFNQDEQYVMVQVMMQECSTDDAGKRAVAEASSNYGERHNATLYQVLTNQVHKNYVSAYWDLYTKHTAQFREATQTDYDILNEAAAGVRIIFPREIYDNNRVTQWCSRGYSNSDFAKWTFVKTVGDNDFYYGDP